MAGSKRRAYNARPRPLSWLVCVRSPPWKVWETRCGRSWMTWPRWTQAGWSNTSARTGVSAPVIGWRTLVCRTATTSAPPWLSTSERMDFLCCPSESGLMRLLRGKHSTVCSRVWQPSYELAEGKARWRAGPIKEEGAGGLRSPSDPEAHTGTRRDTTWLGDTSQVTDTCGRPEDPLRPQVMVPVHTTVAPVPDADRTAPIQEE
jgi:hypothetical protein